MNNLLNAKYSDAKHFDIQIEIQEALKLLQNQPNDT